MPSKKAHSSSWEQLCDFLSLERGAAGGLECRGVRLPTHLGLQGEGLPEQLAGEDF